MTDDRDAVIERLQASISDVDRLRCAAPGSGGRVTQDELEGWNQAMMFSIGKCYENLKDVATRLRAAKPAVRVLDDWHEDHGNAVWWALEDGEWLGEPAWIGTPNDSDWPGYHTHWTPHPPFPPVPDAAPEPPGEPSGDDVERVAEALWRAEADRTGMGKVRARSCWNDDLNDETRDQWRFMARAAIKAMGRPG